jgi:hypothetical protein
MLIYFSMYNRIQSGRACGERQPISKVPTFCGTTPQHVLHLGSEIIVVSETKPRWCAFQDRPFFWVCFQQITKGFQTLVGVLGRTLLGRAWAWQHCLHPWRYPLNSPLAYDLRSRIFCAMFALDRGQKSTIGRSPPSAVTTSTRTRPLWADDGVPWEKTTHLFSFTLEKSKSLNSSFAWSFKVSTSKASILAVQISSGRPCIFQIQALCFEPFWTCILSMYRSQLLKLDSSPNAGRRVQKDSKNQWNIFTFKKWLLLKCVPIGEGQRFSAPISTTLIRADSLPKGYLHGL